MTRRPRRIAAYVILMPFIVFIAIFLVWMFIVGSWQENLTIWAVLLGVPSFIWAVAEVLSDE